MTLNLAQAPCSALPMRLATLVTPCPAPPWLLGHSQYGDTCSLLCGLFLLRLLFFALWSLPGDSPPL